MAKSFNPGGVWQPFGAFSQAVIGGDGRTVYVKGQVSLGAEGQVVGEGNMTAQVHQALQNVQAILASMNGRMSDIVSLMQFTTDINAFMQAGEVRAAFFEAPYPVTTTLEVSALYDPRLMIEITAIAEIPSDRFQGPDGALEMHG